MAWAQPSVACRHLDGTTATQRCRHAYRDCGVFARETLGDPQPTAAAPHACSPEAALGDRGGARPAKYVRSAKFRPISNFLNFKVMRRPLESAQYTSISLTEALTETEIADSVGSVGEAP